MDGLISLVDTYTEDMWCENTKKPPKSNWMVAVHPFICNVFFLTYIDFFRWPYLLTKSNHYNFKNIRRFKDRDL